MTDTTRAAALGSVLQAVRAARGWSIETAAEQAHIGHMTWRRLERGHPVRVRSYAAIDRLLELPAGTVKRALDDDTVLAELQAGAPLARPQHRVSDVEAVANVLDRLTRQRMTDRMSTAVQALLDVMPDLLERSTDTETR